MITKRMARLFNLYTAKLKHLKKSVKEIDVRKHQRVFPVSRALRRV